ncbi:MAG TPA: PP2C family protein-serine/threonine phosphatase [Vicinamibacteria bacterium]|nr:PP2C family protein-serine/threonine phosphatase [Vicinamibacteria bacterium]
MDTVSRLDAKPLYRHLDRLFGAVDGQRTRKKVMESFLEEFFRTFADDLHLRGGVIYEPRRDDIALLSQVGDLAGVAAETLDPELPPVRLIFRHGVYIFPEPGWEEAPARFGLLPPGPAAGVAVGRKPDRFVLLFLLGPGWVREELDFALNTVRAALGARLMEERLRGGLTEAARIQQSLLVEEPPPFAGYDIAARSLPAEEVGGDFFDFLPFDDGMIGLAIGDASGHGLPAALLVRDVVTGLRMGIDKDLKIAQVFARLNRVIHRSNLSSRFVSVFYGEIEAGGDVAYVNAGHPAPLLFSRGQVSELATGGTVVGPLPETRFRHGHARLVPGDVLVMCTDGILERRDSSGEFFGEARLKAAVQEKGAAGAGEILEGVFRAAADFSRRRTWEDDATLVVVRRRETSGRG